MTTTPATHHRRRRGCGHWIVGNLRGGDAAREAAAFVLLLLCLLASWFCRGSKGGDR